MWRMLLLWPTFCNWIVLVGVFQAPHTPYTTSHDLPLYKSVCNAASVLAVHFRFNEKWKKVKVRLRVAKPSKHQVETKETFPPNPRRANIWLRSQQTHQKWELEWILERQLQGGVHWKQQKDWNLTKQWPSVFWMCELTSSSVTSSEEPHKCLLLYICSCYCLFSFSKPCC